MSIAPQSILVRFSQGRRIRHWDRTGVSQPLHGICGPRSYFRIDGRKRPDGSARPEHSVRLVAGGADPQGDRGRRLQLRAGPLPAGDGARAPPGRPPPRPGAGRRPGHGRAGPRAAHPHARALGAALGPAGLRRVLHGPGSVRAGTRAGNAALQGLISYAAEVGASHVVYHAANLPDEPSSEDGRLAETRALAGLAAQAERLGVIIDLENLAPVYPSPDALSFTPMILPPTAKPISSPAVGLCIDVGHATSVA